MLVPPLLPLLRCGAEGHSSLEPFPALAPLRLRNSYLTAQEEFTRLRLLDTRIALYQETEGVLHKKAALVAAAAVLLGVGVILTVIGSML